MERNNIWLRLPLGDNFDMSKLISSVDEQIEKDFREQGQPPVIKLYEEPGPANPINVFYYELDAKAAPYLEKWLSETAGLDVKFSASKENVVDREGFPMVEMSKPEFLRLCTYVKSQYGEAFQQYAESLRYKLIERVVFLDDRDPLDGISPKEAGTLLSFLDTQLSPTFQQVFDPNSATIVKEIADGVCAAIK